MDRVARFDAGDAMTGQRKRRSPAGTGLRENNYSGGWIVPHRPPAWQVARLRATARAMGFDPVFVGDAPLVVELFDASGRRSARWKP